MLVWCKHGRTYRGLIIERALLAPNGRTRKRYLYRALWPDPIFAGDVVLAVAPVHCSRTGVEQGVRDLLERMQPEDLVARDARNALAGARENVVSAAKSAAKVYRDVVAVPPSQRHLVFHERTRADYDLAIYRAVEKLELLESS